jgi:hypothetical protein
MLRAKFAYDVRHVARLHHANVARICRAMSAQQGMLPWTMTSSSRSSRITVQHHREVHSKSSRNIDSILVRLLNLMMTVKVTLSASIVKSPSICNQACDLLTIPEVVN